MLRLLPIGLLALAACDEADPAGDHLNQALADNEIVCFQGTGPVIPDANRQEMLACMNDALANGQRAMASLSYQDAHGFPFVAYAFTVDHQVKSFTTHPTGDDAHYMEPYVEEGRTCSGPFRIEGGRLAWSGCS